ncbi:MAG TPA: hypothetical protein VMG40_03570 [Bryobacteraceae bacterium]|nr:hypothetical protein [Bryobacteraceae bacterium]
MRLFICDPDFDLRLVESGGDSVRSASHRSARQQPLSHYICRGIEHPDRALTRIRKKNELAEHAHLKRFRNGLRDPRDAPFRQNARSGIENRDSSEAGQAAGIRVPLGERDLLSFGGEPARIGAGGERPFGEQVGIHIQITDFARIELSEIRRGRAHRRDIARAAAGNRNLPRGKAREILRVDGREIQEKARSKKILDWGRIPQPRGNKAGHRLAPFHVLRIT